MAHEAVNSHALSKSQLAYQWIKARIGDGTFSPVTAWCSGRSRRSWA